MVSRLYKFLAGLSTSAFLALSFGAEIETEPSISLIDSYRNSLLLGSYVGISYYCKDISFDYTSDAKLMERGITAESEAMSDGIPKSLLLAVLIGIDQGKNGFLFSPVDGAFLSLSNSLDLKTTCESALSEFLNIRNLK